MRKIYRSNYSSGMSWTVLEAVVGERSIDCFLFKKDIRRIFCPIKSCEEFSTLRGLVEFIIFVEVRGIIVYL